MNTASWLRGGGCEHCLMAGGEGNVNTLPHGRWGGECEHSASWPVGRGCEHSASWPVGRGIIIIIIIIMSVLLERLSM